MLILALAGIAAWYDTKFRRVPMGLCADGFVLGIFLNGWRGALSGIVLVITLPWIARYFGRRLGGGDIKLAGAIGALLGPAHTLAALFVACLLTVRVRRIQFPGAVIALHAVAIEEVVRWAM